VSGVEPGNLGLDRIDEGLVAALEAIEKAAAAYWEAPLELTQEAKALDQAAAILRKVVVP
jgi:hypothetical protein